MILIPTFNSQEYIEKTIISALKQTKEVEVIVVDNCSTDGTLEVIKKYPVHLIQNKKNLGRIANWNRCLEIALSKEPKYFKLLFAGDILKSDAFEKYDKIFSMFPTVGLLTSKYEIIEADGKKVLNQTIDKEQLIDSKKALELNLIKNNWYASPSIQVYRTITIQETRFDDNYPWVADWKFCIDISKKSNVYYCDSVLAEFHMKNRMYYNTQLLKLSSIAEEMYIMTSLMEELGLSSEYERKMKKYFRNRLISKKELPIFILDKVLQ